jgi:hypothetical protein
MNDKNKETNKKETRANHPEHLRLDLLCLFLALTVREKVKVLPITGHEGPECK